MQNLVEAEPSDENLTFLAELYAEEGLFDDAATLHLRVLIRGGNDGAPPKG